MVDKTDKIFIILVCVVLLIGAIMLTKNSMLFNFRTDALDMVSERSKQIIEEGGNWMKPYDVYDEYGKYNEQMYDFTKWTFDDYFKDLEKKLKEK